MNTLWLVGFYQVGVCFPRKLWLGKGSLEIIWAEWYYGYIACSSFVSIY